MRSSTGKATQSHSSQQCASVKATVDCVHTSSNTYSRVRGEVCMHLSRRRASECVLVRRIGECITQAGRKPVGAR